MLKKVSRDTKIWCLTMVDLHSSNKGTFLHHQQVEGFDLINSYAHTVPDPSLAGRLVLMALIHMEGWGVGRVYVWGGVCQHLGVKAGVIYPTFPPTGNLEWPITRTSTLHVFGLWEESGEKPYRYRDNMQTQHRNVLSRNQTQTLLAVRRQC